MKQVSSKPTTGQFVALWVHEGKIWCDTYRHDGDTLLMYRSENDSWEEASFPVHTTGDIAYYTL